MYCSPSTESDEEQEEEPENPETVSKAKGRKKQKKDESRISAPWATLHPMYSAKADVVHGAKWTVWLARPQKSPKQFKLGIVILADLNQSVGGKSHTPCLRSLINNEHLV